MRLLADENCPGPIVERLREEGHDVVWIRDVKPGASDPAVLEQAHAEARLLLTFDKDFGELACRGTGARPPGVILLRLSVPSPEAAASSIASTLGRHPGWEGSFSVIEDTRVRRRPLPG